MHRTERTQIEILRSQLATAEAERDLARQTLKACIAELTPETTCPPSCDSYGHAEDCRATSALAEFRALKKERNELKARAEKAEAKLKGNP